jgi:hypothetical protein
MCAFSSVPDIQVTDSGFFFWRATLGASEGKSSSQQLGMTTLRPKGNKFSGGERDFLEEQRQR